MIRRSLAAALFALLAACASASPGIDLPAKAPTTEPTITRTVPPPTPFSPLAPTLAAAQPLPNTPEPGGWAAPNTYGHWGQPAIPIPPPADPIPLPEGSLNILLLGSDRRTGTGFRTDTIVLASIEPSANAVALISFPRDLYVYLPGNSISRINTAWIYGQAYHYPGGGPQLLMDTVRYNFGVPVDRYALVEMDGFQRIVDALGGIDVRVSCPYTDWRLRRPGLPEQRESSWHLFTVQPGILHMDGDEALWYARARQHSTDFDRTRRQQEVLRAAYREALKPEVLARIPALYQAYHASVVTNLTLDDLLDLAPFAVRLGPVNLRSRFVGRGQVRSWRVPSSGAAVLLPDAAAIRHLLEQAVAPQAEGQAEPRRVTVEIVPGASASLDQLAQERLLYGGIDAVLTHGDPQPAPATRVTAGPDAPREDVTSVLTILGLSGAAAETDSNLSPPDAIRLTVGGDYRPCFDPARSIPSP